MIFSVDVEDWAQSVLDRSHPVSERVYINTNKLLEMLDESGHKATFFTLANVAKRYPQLIKQIVDNGHEIASHGCNHINLYRFTPEELTDDVERSVKVLEDSSGKKVIGYRAPNFSLRENLFETYCEALASNGLRYDSSLFPMAVRRYGIERKYSLATFHKFGLDEHYLSYTSFAGKKWPFFGGGYFRLAPYFLTKYFSQQFNAENSGVFYMHPFEIDTGEYAEIKSRYGDIPPLKNQYFISRRTVTRKLQHLMRDFRFSSFKNTYYSHLEI